MKGVTVCFLVLCVLVEVSISRTKVEGKEMMEDDKYRRKMNEDEIYRKQIMADVKKRKKMTKDEIYRKEGEITCAICARKMRRCGGGA